MQQWFEVIWSHDDQVVNSTHLSSEWRVTRMSYAPFPPRIGGSVGSIWSAWPIGLYHYTPRQTKLRVWFITPNDPQPSESYERFMMSFFPLNLGCTTMFQAPQDRAPSALRGRCSEDVSSKWFIYIYIYLAGFGRWTRHNLKNTLLIPTVGLLCWRYSTCKPFFEAKICSHTGITTPPCRDLFWIWLRKLNE